MGQTYGHWINESKWHKETASKWLLQRKLRPPRMHFHLQTSASNQLHQQVWTGAHSPSSGNTPGRGTTNLPSSVWYSTVQLPRWLQLASLGHQPVALSNAALQSLTHPRHAPGPTVGKLSGNQFERNKEFWVELSQTKWPSQLNEYCNHKNQTNQTKYLWTNLKNL